jgi:hypothetical protein
MIWLELTSLPLGWYSLYWVLALQFSLRSLQVFGKKCWVVALFSWLQPSPTHRLQCSSPSQCATLKIIWSNSPSFGWELGIFLGWHLLWCIPSRSTQLLPWSLFLIHNSRPLWLAACEALVALSRTRLCCWCTCLCVLWTAGALRTSIGFPKAKLGLLQPLLRYCHKHYHNTPAIVCGSLGLR